MKNPLLTSFTILCLLTTIFLMGLALDVQLVKAEPGTWTVDDDGPADFPTIQEAISHADSRDTIFVYNGTYYEHVVINKSLSLVGEDIDSTIIDGGGTGSAVSVTANYVNINGFTIRNSGDSDSGIYVTSSGNNISHNTIANNQNGIYLHYSDSNTISDNNVYSSIWYGIYVEYSESNTISSNNAYSNNRYGIYLQNSNNNTVSNNDAYSNYDDGINIHYSSNNKISDNNAYSNKNGINLRYSDYNEISDNNASNNDIGIWIRQLSSNNEISGNNAYSNKKGIYLYYSSNNNIICHNNFFNNTEQVESKDSVNVWDDGDEGNYWSDYTGQDLNEDGIGDDPYVIDEHNQDNHPLRGRFSDFEITWKEETYHANTICNSTISEFTFEVGTETGNKIISFRVTGEDGTGGFCRVAAPTDLMNYPFAVLIDEEEIIPTLLDVPDETHVHLHFTYVHSSHTIKLISSKLLYLYNELLDKYAKLLMDFDDLNSTYDELLSNYNALMGDYSQLQESYTTLNLTTYELLGNYSQLLERYGALNMSYQEHLLEYSELQGYLWEHAQNIRSLVYVIVATTAILIVAAVYLSTHVHRKSFQKLSF